MKSTSYFNPTDQEKAVPVPRRLEGPSEQSYQYQLGIDVSEMVQNCLEKRGKIKILDIGGFHARATSDMVDLLSPADKPAEVSIIDLPEARNSAIERPKHTVFIGGDLNDDFFLHELPGLMEKQQVMFMNQVTQYLQDRLGVIKFFFDELLERDGSFYVNIVSDSFIHSPACPESFIFEALEGLWERTNGVQLKKSKVTMGRRITYQYHLRKTTNYGRLPVPTLKYSKDDRVTEDLVYVKSAYNFNEIRE